MTQYHMQKNKVMFKCLQ